MINVRGHRFPTFAGAARSGLPGVPGSQAPVTTAPVDPTPIGYSGAVGVDSHNRMCVSFPWGRGMLAEDGSYFIASSWTQNPPTLGSATFVAAQTTFGVNAPNFLIQNNSPSGVNITGASYSISLDSLKMVATAAATAATAIHYAVVLDPASIRTPTVNNMTAAVLSCPNGLYAVGQPFGPPAAAQLPKVLFQSSATASTLPAASASAFLAARGVLGGLNIIGDELQVIFGDFSSGQTPATPVESAGQPGGRSSSSGPVLVPPGGSAAVHIWMPGSSASFNPEFVMGLSFR